MLGGIILSRKKEDKHENKKIEISESGEIKQKRIGKILFQLVMCPNENFQTFTLNVTLGKIHSGCNNDIGY